MYPDDSVIIFGIIDQFNGLPPPKKGGRENPDNTPDKEDKYCETCKKETTVNRCVCHDNSDVCYPEHLAKEHVSQV